jgi:hypothetical protein
MEYIAVCIYMRYRADGFVLRQRALEQRTEGRS